MDGLTPLVVAVFLLIEAARAGASAPTPNAAFGLPEQDSPCDDPGRLRLGPQWERWIETSLAALDSCEAARGSRSREVLLSSVCTLLPEFAARYIAENYFWPAALYDPRLLTPGRLFVERAHGSDERAMGYASMAAAARCFDWSLACSLATRAYAAADSADDPASTAWQVIDFMESELTRELNVHRSHLDKARELYEIRAGALTGTGLRDPAELWDTLRPFLVEAMDSSIDGECRNPAGADLETNRLLTTPGLRLFDSIEFTSSGGKPQFQGYLVEPGAPPQDWESDTRATQTLFRDAHEIDLRIEFYPAVPSSHPEYVATDGFWEITTSRCTLEVKRQPGTKRLIAKQDGLVFILRKDGAIPDRWRVAAQLPAR
jgi:hypothetical protein